MDPKIAISFPYAITAAASPPPPRPHLIRACSRTVLNTEPTVHTHNTDIVDPSDPEMHKALGLKELLCNPGVLGAAIEHSAKATQCAADCCNKLLLMTIPPDGLLDKHISGLFTSLEPRVALPPKQRLISPHSRRLHVA